MRACWSARWSCGRGCSRRSPGSALCVSGWGESLLRDDFEEGMGAVLAAMARQGGAVGLAEACALAWETVAAGYVLDDLTDQQLATLRQLNDRDVRHALEVLGQLGAVRFGDGESVGLTELARWALGRRLGAPTPGDPVLQVRITLAEVADPAVWRRLLVPAAIRLDRLHQVIQATMGWDNYHLHVFSDGRVNYGIPDPELAFRDERKATLHDLIPREGGRARYTYDFGDDWEHEILVEKLLVAEPGLRYPLCVAGEGACPPEDCGGAWGYAHLRQVLADPASEEHDDLLAWLGLGNGTDFDPPRFDVEQANRALSLVEPVGGEVGSVVQPQPRQQVVVLLRHKPDDLPPEDCGGWGRLRLVFGPRLRTVPSVVSGGTSGHGRPPRQTTPARTACACYSKAGSTTSPSQTPPTGRAVTSANCCSSWPSPA